MLLELFVQLLCMSLTAAPLVLLVLGARALIRKSPRWVICLLWSLVFIRLLCPYGLFPVEVSENLPGAAVIQQLEVEQSPATNGSSENQQTPIEKSAPNAAPKLPSVSDDISVDSANSGFSLLSFLAILWALGAAGLLFYSLITYCRLQRKLRFAVRIANGVYSCDAVAVPFVSGIFKPRIYLPTTLPQENREHVLAHEHMHIKRRDYIVKPLAFCLTCIHWFNPLAWVAFYIFSKDMELACDEGVIRQVQRESRAAYSESLITLATTEPERQWAPVASLFFGKGSVKGRVLHILHYKKPTARQIVTTIVLTVCVAALCMTEIVPMAAKANGVDPIQAIIPNISEEQLTAQQLETESQPPQTASAAGALSTADADQQQPVTQQLQQTSRAVAAPDVSVLSDAVIENTVYNGMTTGNMSLGGRILSGETPRMISGGRQMQLYRKQLYYLQSDDERGEWLYKQLSDGSVIKLQQVDSLCGYFFDGNMLYTVTDAHGALKVWQINQEYSCCSEVFYKDDRWCVGQAMIDGSYIYLLTCDPETFGQGHLYLGRLSVSDWSYTERCISTYDIYDRDPAGGEKLQADAASKIIYHNGWVYYSREGIEAKIRKNDPGPDKRYSYEICRVRFDTGEQQTVFSASDMGAAVKGNWTVHGNRLLMLAGQTLYMTDLSGSGSLLQVQIPQAGLQLMGCNGGWIYFCDGNGIGVSKIKFDLTGYSEC